jgi:molybdenum cofactor cytidylyltransferase
VTPLDSERICALILAAGESTRMGRLKQLLPWDGTTLIDWQVRQMREAGAGDVVVVLGHEAATVGAALKDSPTRVVVNEGYREGRATSVRRGAEALPDDAGAVLVLSVDQPRPAWIARKLIESWRESGASLAIPSVARRRGHPLLVAGALLSELRGVTEAEMGLRAVTERHAHETLVVPIERAVVRFDLNTPADYESALASFEAGEWSEP